MEMDGILAIKHKWFDKNSYRSGCIVASTHNSNMNYFTAFDWHFLCKEKEWKYLSTKQTSFLLTLAQGLIWTLVRSFGSILGFFIRPSLCFNWTFSFLILNISSFNSETVSLSTSWPPDWNSKIKRLWLSTNYLRYKYKHSIKYFNRNIPLVANDTKK